MRAVVAVAAAVAVVLALVAGAARADPVAGCSFTDENSGNEYDLSSLLSPTFYTGQSDVYSYDFNICGPVNGVSNCEGSMCQYYNGAIAAVIAYWAAPQWSLINESDPDSGVTFTAQSGTTCDIEGVKLPRVSIWKFPCVPDGPEVGQLVVSGNVANLTTCQAVYTIPTSVSCSGGGGGGGGGHGLSGGWVFIILLIVFSVLYCGVGAFLQHRKGATGADLCPNREFWRGFPGLVKDGCLFTKAKVQGLSSGGGGGGYQQTA